MHRESDLGRSLRRRQRRMSDTVFVSTMSAQGAIFMFSSIFAGFFQDWLRAKPRQFSIWLYGTEAVVATLVAALLLLRILGGGVWTGLGFLWYASYCVMLYFHWDRRRTLKEEKPWKPTGTAKAWAVTCFLGLTMLGGGLVAWSVGAVPRITTVGIIIAGIGLYELYCISKRGWPRLGK